MMQRGFNMKGSLFLAVVAATSLLACGQSEKVSTPPAQLSDSSSPQTESLPAAVAEPVPPVADQPAVATETTPVAAQPAATIVKTRPADVPAAKPAPAAEPTAAPAPQPDLAHGQQIYRQACAFCHDKGVAGAPRLGDAAAWSPRLAQGMEVLHASALRGKGAMPAKGGNPSLADSDVIAAVDYLSAQAR